MDYFEAETPQFNKVVPAITAAVLISALVAGGGVYAYQKGQADSTQKDLQAQIDSLKNKVSESKMAVATAAPTAMAITTPSATPYTVATWKVYKSNSVNLSFKSPSSSVYKETEPLAERASKDKSAGQTPINYSGHQIYFADQSKSYPDFDATSLDFKALDSVTQNMITGSLDNKSFTVATFDKNTSIVTEIASGIYQVTGYGNLECSPFVNSYLFVRPPQGAGLKYLSFFLGADDQEFAQSEVAETCNPKADAITKRISNLNSDAKVKSTLDKAIAIAKTFAVK